MLNYERAARNSNSNEAQKLQSFSVSVKLIKTDKRCSSDG